MYWINPRPHRIAMISAHTSPLGRLGGHKTGGLNVYVRETAAELARRGHLVDIFTRDDGTQPEIVPFVPGVRTVHLPAGPRVPDLDKDAVWEYLPAFLHSLRAFRERHGLRYDAIFSHYWMSGWAGTYLQRLWDVPHVTMFHTLGEAKNRAREGEHEPPHRIHTERRVVATADAVVAATDHERDLLCDLYDAEPARVATIPCGVNPALFHAVNRDEARMALGFGAAEQMVLFVGRLEPLKGVDLLIDALPDLPAVTLVIAGGDDLNSGYARQLADRARALGVAGRVRFEGAVPQDRLPQYYGAADVCAIPSFYESFGLVALEAMACGTPVVATRVGGLTTTVRDGHNGFLIPWRTPQAFAGRIAEILDDGALHGRMSAAARATAARFSWSRVTDELEDLYVRLMETRAMQGCHGAGRAAALASGEHPLCHIG